MKPFSRKYRHLLSQNALQAPDDVWTNLSSQLDTDAAKIHLNAREEELIDEVWAGLEEQLDIDQVWGNISDELDKVYPVADDIADVKDANKTTQYNFNYRYWVAAAILLLLLMGDAGLVHFISNRIGAKHIADVPVQYLADSINVNGFSGSDYLKESKIASWSNSYPKSPVSTSMAMKLDAETTKNIKEIQESEANKVSPSTHGLIAKTSVAIAMKDHNRQNNIDLGGHQVEVLKLALSAAHDSYLMRKEALITPYQEFEPELEPLFSGLKTMGVDVIEGLALPKKKNKEPGLMAYNKKYSPWSTGIVTAIKNTYLLNAETKEGFSPSGMNESKITVLPDIGLNVQYALSQRYILNSNLFLSSSSKQNYNTYNHGEYVGKQLQLDYMKGEFAIKQSARNNIFGADKLIRRNIVGVYVAMLQSASETLVKEQVDISSKYTALDYGLVLGQEIEFVSQGPLKVATGLTVKYGLPNIYAGDSSLPGNLNQTHNASFEFRVGIAYNWKSNRSIDHYLSLLIGK